jgi:hypothetical protein
MANLFPWYVRSHARKILCGECVTLIVQQEYDVGHPHMHLQDGFELTFKSGTNLSSSQQDAKRLDWGAVVHLHPDGTEQRLTTLNKGEVIPTDRVSIQKNVLPKNNSYLTRTGVKAKAKVPAVMGTKKIPIMDRTTKLQKTNANGPMWVMVQGSPKLVPYTITPKVPAVQGTIPHSMFEDGESAVMSLTAVFNSKAGSKALNLLHLGVAKAVIRSRSAVAALTAATKPSGTSTHSLRNIKIRMQEWRHNPLAKTFTPTTVDVNHTVTVLKRSSTGDLILTTHYPVAESFTTAATSGVTTTPADILEWKPKPTTTVSDPAEAVFGLNQDFPLPPVRWNP